MSHVGDGDGATFCSKDNTSISLWRYQMDESGLEEVPSSTSFLVLNGSVYFIAPRENEAAAQPVGNRLQYQINYLD